MYSIIVVSLLSWSPAINLGIPGVNDRYPQSVRWQAEHTCLVWQAEIDSSWEIFSRFFIPDIPFYTDTIRITNDSTDDFYPVVAYDRTRQCFWCAWMGWGSSFFDIFVSQGDAVNGWSIPNNITDDVSYDGEPSICVINDTVWVLWNKENIDNSYNIYYSFYDGSNWSQPEAITNDSIPDNTLPKINGHYNHPLAIWMKNAYLYYSERIGGVWQNPLPVGAGLYGYKDPEIAVQCNPVTGYNFEGAWIFWSAIQDVYCTALDTFDIYYRLTYSPYLEDMPSPLDFVALIGRYNPTSVAFAKLNATRDIYVLFGWSGWDTIAVDTFLSWDQYPCMSGGDWRIWIFWETNRNGDWDICGSQMWVGGIEDNASGVTTGDGNILTAWPNPFAGNTLIKFQISNTKNQTNPKFQITLRIYDATGRMVRSFLLPTAYYLLPAAVTWSGTDDLGMPLAPGVYFCRLQQGELIVTTKLIKTE